MSSLYVDVYTMEEPDYVANFKSFYEDLGYTVKDTTISGSPCLEANGVEVQEDGGRFNNKNLLIQKDSSFVEFNFYIHEDFGNAAEAMFNEMVKSIVLS